MDDVLMIETLKSIDATLKRILAISEARSARNGSGPAIASDADLDGQYGDPEVRAKDPRDWTGDSMKGRRFSECPPEYLDLLAQRFDWFAEQAEAKNELYNGKPVAPMKRKDAARARGWAARLRAGWKPAETPAAATTDDWSGGSDWGTSDTSSF